MTSLARGSACAEVLESRVLLSTTMQIRMGDLDSLKFVDGDGTTVVIETKYCDAVVTLEGDNLAKSVHNFYYFAKPLYPGEEPIYVDTRVTGTNIRMKGTVVPESHAGFVKQRVLAMTGDL